MTTDIKMDEETFATLSSLTSKWANAALSNNAGAMVDARNEMSKTLKAFDDKHGTREMSKDADMLERSENAAEYMRKRMQYLQQRCG